MARCSPGSACTFTGRAQGGSGLLRWGWAGMARALNAGRAPGDQTYYWMTYIPPFHLEGPETDVTSLCEGYITVTPLHFDLTRGRILSPKSRLGSGPIEPNVSNEWCRHVFVKC